MFGFWRRFGGSDGELNHPAVIEEEKPFSLSSPTPQLPQAVIPIPNTSMASSFSSFSSDRGSSSRSYSYRYDVFLSFRGEDTRMRFVDHLYTALVDKLIFTFKDDNRLLPGESIGPSLFTAIEESRIALIVFSENYADSSWCLQELEYIMKCNKERGLIVMPVFYDVEPTDVRKQKNKFGEAFARYENEDTNKVESWKTALADACNNVGFDSKNRHEAEFVKEIVDKIFRTLLPSESDDDEELVGIPTRLQDLISQLDLGSDHVLRVGIWGIGGGGKTTLANSFYTKMSRLFHGSCIVEDIGVEVSKNYLKELQKKILSDIFDKEVNVKSFVDGKNMMKTMLGNKKVLVVLDDVHDREQLEALAGSLDWFGKGSRIIITTRDENLLDKVEVVYPLRLFSHEEAVKLFNKHARNEKWLIEDYKRISLRVVSYCAGLPLALKVLGSFLYDKNEEEWMSALDRLKDIPEMKIVEKLKISYDGLTTEEKELFLDIACYFRGKNLNDSEDNSFDNTREILDACNFHLQIEIKVLKQKALINIDAKGRFEMHDLIQEMAHYVVRGDHPNNPEYHSRLWEEKEIINLYLWDATQKNDKIETIGRYYASSKDVMSRLCKNVSNMKKLRWLDMRFSNVGDGDEGPTFLSNELRYINWFWYPGISFPDNFRATKLVVLKLESSLQKVLWKSNKDDLPCLKVLELIHMKNLVSTPDFKRLPCLQKLRLFLCEELEEIHPSLGNHTSLEYVRVDSCRKLRKFPTIVHMGKLETLSIKECKKIVEFPKIQQNMESLVNLSLIETGIKVLPSSIGERCTNLTSLDLIHCTKLKRIEFNMDALIHLKEFKCSIFRNPWFQLPRFMRFQLSKIMRFHQFPCSLKKLVLSNCGIKDGKIISGILELSNLEELDLSDNYFSRLDSGLSQLTRLKILNLKDCRSLVGLSELPSSVAILKAPWCESLTETLTNCKSLREISISPGGMRSHGYSVLEYMLQGKAMANEAMVFELKGGRELAKGFTPGVVRKGEKCRLQLAENWRNEFSGFLMCAVGKRSFDVRMVIKICVEELKSGSMVSDDEEVDLKKWFVDLKISDDDDDDEVDCEDEVEWKESDDDNTTWVGYISFASLRDTPWWDQTYNHLLFDLKDDDKYLIDDDESWSGFGVQLIGKTSETGGDPTSFSQFSDYKSDLYIEHVSPYALKIFFPSNNFITSQLFSIISFLPSNLLF